MVKHHIHHNCVRTYRKRSGLTQRELAIVLGYSDLWQISRHERSRSWPSLRIALAYEVVFQVPLATIFQEARRSVERAVELKLNTLERNLRERGQRQTSDSVTHKLKWLGRRVK